MRLDPPTQKDAPAAMPRSPLACLAILIAATASPASAQTSASLAKQLFGALDRDRNGVVTVREFNFMRGIDFGRLDRNGDGVVDRKEFVDLRTPKSDVSARARQIRALRAQRFVELDADRDTRISNAEYMAYGKRIFRRLDRNGDGKLTLAEVQPAGATVATKPKTKPKPVAKPVLARPVTRSNPNLAARPAAKPPALKTPPAKTPPAGTPGAKTASAPADPVFRQIDTNADGVISLDELLTARKLAFSLLDANKNGALSSQEFARRGQAAGGPAQGGTAQGGSGSGATKASAKLDTRFIQLDKNGDGRVTRSEYMTDGRARFLAADRNNDGRLSSQEFQSGTGG